MAEVLNIIGLDIGSEKVMTVLSNGEVIRNELGGVGNSSVVAFSNKSRLIGESGVPVISSNPSNCITGLKQLAGAEYSAWSTVRGSQHRAYQHFADPNKNTPSISFLYRDEQINLNGTVLLAMLLAKVKANFLATKNLMSEFPLSVAIAFHSSTTLKERRAISDAAKIAGFHRPKLFTSADCIAALFSRKHSIPVDALSRIILFVDMGSSQTEISIVKFLGGGGTEIITSIGTKIGAAEFDFDLFDYFRVKVKEQYNEDVKPGTKRGARLLRACRRLRELLSTIPEATTTVENLCEDRDVPLSLTRTELHSLCESSINAFSAILQAALAKAGPQVKAELCGVELFGGGTRMPCIQEILSRLNVPMGLKLDDAALACGAAILGTAAGLDFSSEEIDKAEGMSDDEIKAAQEIEEAMAARDKELMAIAEHRNAMEGLILSMRSAKEGPHGGTLPMQTLEPLLDEVDDWLYSDEADKATIEQMREKYEIFAAQLKEICASYFEEQDKKKLVFEQSLEEESARAAEERLKDPNAMEEEADRDQRRLKKPERMRLLVKNKEEGNELFQGKNWTAAGARYAKALSHAAKFIDLNPDEQAEVNALKVSLYLNLSQCYLKLEKWDMVVVNCTHALELDDNSAKAMYRRGYAYYSKKNFDKAEQDLDRAYKLTPDDSSVIKLRSLAKNKLKEQAKAEKSMWAKAFGTK